MGSETPNETSPKVVHIFEVANFELGQECQTLCGIQYVPTGLEPSPSCQACAVVLDRIMAASFRGLTANNPARPVDEVVCPNCELTIRAQMSDQPNNGPTHAEIDRRRAEQGSHIRVMQAHRLEDCVSPSECWFEPHRLGQRLPSEQDGQR